MLTLLYFLLVLWLWRGFLSFLLFSCSYYFPMECHWFHTSIDLILTNGDFYLCDQFSSSIFFLVKSSLHCKWSSPLHQPFSFFFPVFLFVKIIRKSDIKISGKRKGKKVNLAQHWRAATTSTITPYFQRPDIPVLLTQWMSEDFLKFRIKGREERLVIKFLTTFEAEWNVCLCN